MRHRRMAALAGDDDVELVDRRHDRTRRDGDLGRRHAGDIVEREDPVEGKPLEHAVGDHRLGAGPSLFGRLEDQHHGAGEAARGGEIPRRAEEHRHVAVVAAGMHLPRHFRTPGRRSGLGDRQRVHVGAERDPRTVAVPDDRDHAGPADAGRDLVDAEPAEELGHRRRGLVLLIGELRPAMERPPPGDHVGQPRLDLVGDGHVRAHLARPDVGAKISPAAAPRPSLFVS